MDPDDRRVVRARLDPSLVDASVEALTSRAPSDRIHATEGGWVVRDEVPWFVLFSAVALFALALLAHAGASRAPGYPRGLVTLPWVLDAGWALCVWRFAASLYGAWTLSLEGRALCFRRVWRGRAVSESRVDPEDVCVVRVREGRSVIVEGPRQKTLAAPFSAGVLDPPGLPRWVADAIVALSERALAVSAPRSAR